MTESSPPNPDRQPLIAGLVIVAAIAVIGLVALLRIPPSTGDPGPSPSVSGTAAPTASAPASATPTATGVPSPTASAAPSATSSPTAAPTPSPTAPPPAPSASPTSTPPAPSPSSSSVPVAVDGLPTIDTQPLPGAPRLALWTRKDDTTLSLWRWNPASDAGLDPWFDVPLAGPYYAAEPPAVLASPDGRFVAINEHLVGDPASHDVVQVLDAAGHVLWTSPDGSPRTIDMAWAPDSSRLALAAVPLPWTVLTFSASDTITTKTYQLSTDAAYRLIGFNAKATAIIGYESSGEAEFWDKPVSLDLATGTITSIDAFPGGMQSNASNPGQATYPLDRINETNGDVLAIAGGAKGPANWVVKSGSSEQPIGVDAHDELAWSEDTIVDSAPVPVVSGSQPGGWVLSTVEPGKPATLTPVVQFGPGAYTSALASGRDGFVLLGLLQDRGWPATPGWSEAVLVDRSSGHTAVAVAGGSGDLWFAGWLPAAP